MIMDGKRKFRFRDLWVLVRNSFKAILKGEFILRLNLGRYFIHIASCILLVAMTIWISLMIDSTMTRVQKNRRTLEQQQNEIAALTYKMAKATRRTEVEKKLEEMGSKLREPTKPAKQIKENDIIEIEYATRTTKAKVLKVPTGNVSIQQAQELYEIVE